MAEGHNLARTLARLAPVWLRPDSLLQPFYLKGRLAVLPHRLATLEEVTVRLGPWTSSGQIAFHLASWKEVEVNLAFPQLDLDPLATAILVADPTDVPSNGQTVSLLAWLQRLSFPLRREPSVTIAVSVCRGLSV